MFKMLFKAIITAVVVPPLIAIPIIGWLLAFVIVSKLWLDDGSHDE